MHTGSWQMGSCIRLKTDQTADQAHTAGRFKGNTGCQSLFSSRYSAGRILRQFVPTNADVNFISAFRRRKKKKTLSR